MKMELVLQRVLAERDLETVTADQYTRTLRRFEESLGRPAEIRDLSYENVNEWIKQLQRCLGAVTVRNYRRAFLMFWNYLAANGELEPYARQRVRQPKVTPQIVSSWTLDQLTLLLKAAETLDGRLRCGIPVNEFMVAWLWVGFDTGLRPSDMRLVKWNQVYSEQGCVTIVQHKTKYLHTASLSQQSIDALQSLASPKRDRVFPLGKGGMRRWELRLFSKAADFGFTRQSGEGLGRLRSLHATEIYKAEGLSAAAESLGHVGGTRTVKAHYIDAKAVQKRHLPRRPAKCRVQRRFAKRSKLSDNDASSVLSLR